MKSFFLELKNIDWLLLVAILPLLFAGLSVMNSYTDQSQYYERQLTWIVIALAVFFIFSFIDFRFLRSSGILITLFLIIISLLVLLFFVASLVHGTRSWFSIGAFSFQPSDPAKLILILILAKYFSRRHIEIADVKHIIISGIYALVIFLLVLFQPDFGSAIIIFLIWLGLVLVSGISKKHLLLVFLTALTVFLVMWSFVLADYQKQRVLTFIDPLADVRGAGYNAYQSTIAVGSGQLLGKGVGYGTQSRLKFLPEYETDFVFAAFAEEWGFVGVLILFVLFGVIIWRILANAWRGATNFEILFGLGLAILFISHFTVHVGMNIGLLPVTGVTVPFLSYGGSHLLTEFAGLGILMGMRRYRRVAHKEAMKNEFLGV
ncbi:MAG TPA: rod shape-determining protein RodA [Candidatus Paceibacterota bacterium]